VFFALVTLTTTPLALQRRSRSGPKRANGGCKHARIHTPPCPLAPPLDPILLGAVSSYWIKGDTAAAVCSSASPKRQRRKRKRYRAPELVNLHPRLFPFRAPCSHLLLVKAAILVLASSLPSIRSCFPTARSILRTHGPWGGRATLTLTRRLWSMTACVLFLLPAGGPSESPSVNHGQFDSGLVDRRLSVRSDGTHIHTHIEENALPCSRVLHCRCPNRMPWHGQNLVIRLAPGQKRGQRKGKGREW